MPSYYTYSTPVEINTGFSNVIIVNPNGDIAVGATIDNTSDKWTHIDLMVSLWLESSSAAGNAQIGMRYSLDGVTWEDLDAMLVVDSLVIRQGYASAAPYRYMLRDIRILPYYFAITVRNYSYMDLYVMIDGRARKMVFEMP